MPIYEYRRPDGSTFEVIQSFSDEPLTSDPDTGVAVQRVLHAPAVHFKGKGFYNTDYGTRRRQRETENSSSGEKSAQGESSKSSDSDSTKSDSAKSEKSSANSPSEPKPSKKKAEPLATAK